MRDAFIHLRAHPGQRDLIDQAAHAQGKTRSDFMLEAACEKAESVMLDQAFFTLSKPDFQKFQQWLDSPPEENPGLSRLMAVKTPWTAEGPS